MKTEGLITIVFRDKDTLEEVRREEITNTVTQYLDYRLQYGASVGGGSISTGVVTATNNRFLDMRGIGITNYRVKRNLITPSFVNTTENFVLNGQNLQGPVYYAAQGLTPAYWEMKARFQPGASARTFWTIYLCSYIDTTYSSVFGWNTTDGNDHIYAYASLDVPCTQQSTEVLDVYYRLRISDSAITPMTIVSTTDSTALRTQSEAYNDIKNVFISEDRNGYPYKEAAFFTPALKTSTEYKNFAYISEDRMSIYDVGVYRNRHDFSRAVADDVGKIFGSYVVYGSGRQAVLQLKAAPTAFSNKPIQPIHNHNISAQYPFLDVSYLASGQGKMFASTSTWSGELEFPEYYRVDMHNTGETGTASYTYRKKNTLGFQSGPSGSGYPGDYRPGFVRLPWLSGYVETFRTPGAGDGGNYLLDRIEEYSKNKIVVWETTGVTILDVVNGDYITFHAGSSTVLPVTSIYQVAVEDDGTLWVACAGTGLYRIDDPLGTPVVTKMTVAGGLPATVTENNAYAVEVGYAGNIWAMMRGGLCESNDGGTSWTLYNETTPVIFNVPGISNNLWDRTRMIRTDRENPNDLMGIMYYTGQGYASASFYWWDKTGTAAAGPNAGTFASLGGLLTGDGGVARTGRFRCSKYGGLWAAATRPMDTNYQNTGNGYALKFFPRTTAARVLAGMFDLTTYYSNNLFSSHNGVVFMYDMYNNPYVFGQGGLARAPFAGNYFSTYAMYGRTKNGDMTAINDMYFITYTNNSPPTNPGQRGYIFTWEKQENRNNVFIANNPYEYTVNNDDYYELCHIPTRTWAGALNERVPAAEMYWDHYRWDPIDTQWKKDWNTSVSDLSGNGYTGVRKGFRPEDQRFLDRSTVECSNAIGSPVSNFTNQFTVATAWSPVVSQYSSWATCRAPEQTIVDFGRGYTLYGHATGCLLMSSPTGDSVYLDRTPDYDISNRYAVAGTIQNGAFPVQYSKWTLGHWWTNNAMPPVMGTQSSVRFNHHRADGSDTGTTYSNLSVHTANITQLSSAKSFDIEFTRYVRWNTSVQTVGTYNDSAAEQEHYVYIAFGWPTNTYNSSDGLPTVGSSYIRIRIPQHAAGTTGAIHPRFACQGPSGTTTSTDTQFQTITNNTVADDYKFNTRWVISMVWNVDGSYTGTLKTVRANDTVTVIGSFTTTSRWTTRSAGSVIHTSRGKANGTFDGYTLRYNVVAIKDMWLGGMVVRNIKNDSDSVIATTGDYLSVQCYRNGGLTADVKIPTIVAVSPFTRMLIGAEKYKSESTQTSDVIDNFLCGSLGNFQVWNIAWDSADAIGDMIDPSSVIASKPPSNLKLRYLFTDSLVGLESKPTHVAVEPINADINLRFQNGTNAPAFVSTDYYTFGVCDGIMKDNAISFSYQYDTMHKPIVFDMTETPQSTVPSTTSVVTEPIYWRSNNNVYFRHGTSDGSPDGSQMSTAARSRSWTLYYGAQGFQRIEGDGSLQFTIGSSPCIVAFGLDDSVADSLNYVNFRYTWMIGSNAAGTSSGATSASYVLNGSSSVHTGPTANIGDVYKIERVGTTIYYYHNGVLRHSQTGAVSTPLYVRVQLYGEASTIYDCNITYTRPAGWIDLGNPATLTGKYARGYVFTEPADSANFSVSVDGTPITAKRYDGSNLMGLYTPPGVGEVVVIPYGGIAIFNAADYGKTITLLKYATVYDK
jgi:hypothetical protein